MNEFVNILILGSALVAGIVSLFQGVTLMALLKRVGFSMLLFYLVGVGIKIVWETASSRATTQFVEGASDRNSEKDLKGKHA